ncbi:MULTISPECIES: hypothetical protein [Thermodesulfobacterium]|uniref:hypothetical protein n=1 Tax=Thermodesulfobacterium TaxID=1740 RepID=UPI000AE8BDA9|nr:MULTISPECIES: hypothetical protein [Thermodesulfobacterium]
MPQNSLNFKILKTNEPITPCSGLDLVDAFLKNYVIKTLIDQHMPLPGSNRGYNA